MSKTTAVTKWRFDLNKAGGQSLITLGEIAAPIGYDVNYDVVRIFVSN
jgi:hypothetical protein